MRWDSNFIHQSSHAAAFANKNVPRKFLRGRSKCGHKFNFLLMIRVKPAIYQRPHEQKFLLPSSWKKLWTFYRPHERNCELFTVLMKETWTFYRPHERNVNLLPSSWTKIPFTYSWRKLLRPPFTFNVLRIIWKRGNVQKNKSLKRRLNLSRS